MLAKPWGHPRVSMWIDPPGLLATDRRESQTHTNSVIRHVHVNHVGQTMRLRLERVSVAPLMPSVCAPKKARVLIHAVGGAYFGPHFPIGTGVGDRSCCAFLAEDRR